MKENIETKDVQRTEYLDKNGLDMLWAKVKENTQNQVEVERDRATTQENRIIDTKADKSELHSSYVSNSTFTALQEKVAANTDAISDKQDAGNYLSYKTINNEGYYEIPDIRIPSSGGNTKTDIDSQSISVNCDYPASHTTITCDGISNTDNNANHVYATDGSIADLTQYAKKSESVDNTALTALEQKITANTTAIEGKQDAGNYIPYREIEENTVYCLPDSYSIMCQKGFPDNLGNYDYTAINHDSVKVSKGYDHYIQIDKEAIDINDGNDGKARITAFGVYGRNGNNDLKFQLDGYGVKLLGGNDNHVLTSNASTIDITEYAKKSEIPEVDASNFVSKTATDAQIIKSELTVKDNLRVAHDDTNEWFTNINYDGISVVGNDGHDVYINQNDCIKVSAQIDPYWIYSKMDLNEMYLHGNTNSLRIGLDSIKAHRYREHSSNQSDTLFILSEQGVSLYNGDNNHVLTSGGSTIDITQYVLKSVYDEKIAALEARIAALEAKHTETA